MRYPAGLVQAKRKFNPIIDTTMTRLRRSAGERAFVEAVRQASASGPVRVNIGSGGKPLPGWVNSDVVWRVPLYLDATRAWPVPDESVDFVYADNVIEHIPLQLGRQLFAHTFRAMKPGGVFRLATPDVEAVARQYLENGELAQLGLERHRERGRDLQYPVQLIQNVFVGAKHYLGFCYDYASLSAEMEAAGFQTSRQLAGESDYPDLRRLETRVHPAEKATELIVEGCKPR
ncbi:MAG TPA: methyltransferase domain-containing protein [Propionibacteriaceae bacterium]|nr:methyltransferase domain-containing protein [Propionibacteriaceae bacterium]